MYMCCYLKDPGLWCWDIFQEVKTKYEKSQHFDEELGEDVGEFHPCTKVLFFLHTKVHVILIQKKINILTLRFNSWPESDHPL